MQTLAPYFKDKDYVLWDWNGTLLDDLDLCLEVINGVLAAQNRPAITSDDYRDLFGFPVINYYRALGFDFSDISFEELSQAFITRYYEQVHRCDLFRGTAEMLRDLRGLGLKHAIISAAHEEEIHRLLDKHGIDQEFEHVYGLDNHFAHSKLQRGQDLLREAAIDPQRAILVGDTDHDLEVGQALGVDVVLIADGHQSYPRLAKTHDQVLESRY